jgi:hypothetical protein
MKRASSNSDTPAVSDAGRAGAARAWRRANPERVDAYNESRRKFPAVLRRGDVAGSPHRERGEGRVRAEEAQHEAHAEPFRRVVAIHKGADDHAHKKAAAQVHDKNVPWKQARARRSTNVISP